MMGDMEKFLSQYFLVFIVITIQMMIKNRTIQLHLITVFPLGCLGGGVGGHHLSASVLLSFNSAFCHACSHSAYELRVCYTHTCHQLEFIVIIISYDYFLLWGILHDTISLIPTSHS